MQFHCAQRLPDAALATKHFALPTSTTSAGRLERCPQVLLGAEEPQLAEALGYALLLDDPEPGWAFRKTRLQLASRAGDMERWKTRGRPFRGAPSC